MAYEEWSQQPATGLSKERKIGFVLLLAFAILAVGLGVLQIRNNMYSPLALSNAVPPSITDQVNTTDALRYRDTDFDGLNDFDELYVYTTSPYLADSDSDGIPDKQEVLAGTNPLCGEGQDCSAFLSVNSDALGKQTVTSSADLNITATSTIEDIMQPFLDTANVRKLLIQSGMKEADVNKMTDEQITALVNEVMTQTDFINAVSEYQNAANTGGENNGL